MRSTILALLVLALAGCSTKPTTFDEYNTRVVTLPGGKQVRAEVMVSEMDMTRGMMCRDSLAPDRGMLFMHRSPGNYRYWMYQVRIPLDLIWMDHDRQIVEIVADAPPCKTAADQCPTYGGRRRAQYVLELAGGMAARYGLKVGDYLDF
jgi:uncharacterized membrane protein (UPF0127 family)